MKLTRRNFLALTGWSSIPFFALKKSKPEPHPQPSHLSMSSSCDPWIELNLKNMGRNLDKVRRRAKVPVMAVIKANGYGHGLVEVARYLEKEKINSLMVCKLQEAVRLREAGVRCPTHNFGPLSAKDAKVLVEYDISQSVFTEEAQRLNRESQNLGKKTKIHIHIDTGLGRMGIPYHKALPFIESTASLKWLQIIGISTTFTEDLEFDRIQLDRLLTLCQEAKKKGISLGLKHAASSGALLTLPPSYLDMVRPGIVLYGYYPSHRTQEEDSLTLRPVLQLKSRVAAVKTLRPGDSVSYHRAYTAKKREKIAVIPIGYSDGYPHKASGKGSVLIKGKRFPIIASITANHMEVLLSPQSQIEAGDEVVLIGRQGKEGITAVEVAAWTDVSVYKILMGLNPLLPRIIN
ncbi:MAG: alanine racemase [Candidatus Aminicenantes bacterium]